jgi:hypothetical protein
MYLLVKNPIKIQVHHIHEEVKDQLSRSEIESLEEDMNKPDPKQDQFEQNLNEAINNIDSIMGGSDR